MISVPLRALPKLNLTLDVGAARPDGYHEIDSVVCVLAAPGDELTVNLHLDSGANLVTLTCSDPMLPTDQGNLAYRAARDFLHRFAAPGEVSVTIHLEKNLPAQAGLGGGSSNAAAVLRALDRLLPNRATPKSLQQLAATLGSDVPLFLGKSLRRMRGRGEVLETLPENPPALHGVLVKPAVGVPTKEAYARLDAGPKREPGSASARLWTLLNQGVPNTEQLAPLLSNDFESAVLAHWPEVGRAHHAVWEAGALRALLCGSGAAVFGLAQSAQHADQLAERLRPQFLWTVTTRT